jgi:two-component sensor histidine kinase
VNDQPSDLDASLSRTRQQRGALAEFGISAFRCDDLDMLLTKATALVGEGLGIERAKVLQVIEPGDKLLIRAGVGWMPGVVGKVTIDADEGSAAGYALLSGEPVISEDVQDDERFRYPNILREHGIKSAVNVIIEGERKPFGVLEVDSQQKRRFTEDDINFLKSYANLLAAAIDRLESHRKLAAAASQKETLLRELQHRVKNNVQLMAGFVDLERRKASDEITRKILDVIAFRVEALALTYNKLEFRGESSSLEFCSYLKELCRALVKLPAGSTVDINVDCSRLVLNADQALPLGLFVSEFIMNSFKHAFPGGRGTITVMLDQVDQCKARLLLADDGVGSSSTVQSGKGSGIRLMEQLAKQASAKIAWERQRGTRVTLKFPIL